MGKTRDAALRTGEVVKPKNGRLNTNDIKKILPHREPFLFVDEVVEFEENKRIVGLKKITGKEEFFRGHFPGNPILPGVIMIEALAQAGGILLLNREGNTGRSAYFVGIDNVRFRKAVVPGDELRLELEVIKLGSRLGKLRGVVKVGAEKVMEADILLAFGT